MHDCPSFCVFDLLIMIKLVGVWWLVVAKAKMPRVLYCTASHLGPKKRTTKWRRKDDRQGLKTVWPHGGGGKGSETPCAVSLSITSVFLIHKIINERRVLRESLRSVRLVWRCNHLALLVMSRHIFLWLLIQLFLSASCTCVHDFFPDISFIWRKIRRNIILQQYKSQTALNTDAVCQIADYKLQDSWCCTVT